MKKELNFYYLSVVIGFISFGLASLFFKVVSSVDLVLLLVGLTFFWFLYDSVKSSFNIMVADLVNVLYVRYGTLLYLIESLLRLRNIDNHFLGLINFIDGSFKFFNKLTLKWINLVNLSVKNLINVFVLRIFLIKQLNLNTIHNYLINTKFLNNNLVMYKFYLFNNLITLI